MKFGCCLNMLASNYDKTGIEKMQLLSCLGYDYAELPLAEINALSGNDYLRLKEAVVNSGIPCESCNNFFPAEIRLTGPDVNLPLVKAYAERALDTAAELGAHIVVFGSGGAKNIPQGFSYDAAYAQVVALLQYVNDLAAARNIVVCIEPLRRAECNLINTFEEGCRLAMAVDGKNVGVLIDLFHMTEECESITSLTKYGGNYLHHVHIAMPTTRRFPTDKPSCDKTLNQFLVALRSLNYSGRISCEAYSDNFSVDAEATLKLLKTTLTKGTD